MIITSKNGKTFSAVEGESILDAALRAGIVFEYSCKRGLCGLCKATLVKGKVKEIVVPDTLSKREVESQRILMCCSEATTDVLIDAEELTALKEIEIKTIPVKIEERIQLSSDILTVKFRLPPHQKLLFLEGQYIDVTWSGVKRSYSISSIANDTKIELLIKRVCDGVMSDYWFNQAQKNDLLRIEGPKGTFFLRDSSKPILMLATGTGIAPIKSILSELDSDSFFDQKHTIWLFWGNRNLSDFVWDLKFKNLDIRFIPVLSQVNSEWAGELGYVQDVAVRYLGSQLFKHDVYACGSLVMIESTKKMFIKNGLLEKQFYSDAFVSS